MALIILNLKKNISSMPLEDTIKTVIKEFSILDRWEDRYEYLIELGRTLPNMPEIFRQPENMMKDCNSQVWLYTYQKKNRLFFKGDSDALIPKGILALMIRIYSGKEPIEIIKSSPNYLKKIGIENFLSFSRTNGLAAIYSYIKYNAEKYYSKR